MTKLTILGKTLEGRIVPQLKEFFELSLITDGVFLAGGSLRTLIDSKETIVDFDLFFKSTEAAEKTVEAMLNNPFYKKTFVCPEGKLVTFKYQKDNTEFKIQCIKEYFYLSMEDLLNTFDFNACRIAFNGLYAVTYKESVKDIVTKKLTIHRVTYPNATLRRMFKYHDKGYKISKETISKYNDCLINVAEEQLDLRFYID